MTHPMLRHVRRGFTLIEAMVAIVVTGLVVLLAYATLRSGLDVDTQVQRVRVESQSVIAWRTVMQDALRHAVDGALPNAPPFAATTGEGRAPHLAFATRGVTPPLGASAPWLVEVTTDSLGVHVILDALEGEEAPIALHVAGATLGMRYLPLTVDTWSADWHDPSRLPRAVELRLLDRNGHDLSAPLVVRTSPVNGA